MRLQPKKSDSIAHTQLIHSPSMMELKMLRCFGVVHLESNLLFASSLHGKNTKVDSSSLVNILMWSWIFFLPTHTLKKFSYKTQVQLGRVRNAAALAVSNFPHYSSVSPTFRHTHKGRGRLGPGIYIGCLSLLNHPCYLYFQGVYHNSFVLFASHLLVHHSFLWLR